MDLSDFAATIQILASPTTEVPHAMGGLGEGTEFWVRTSGMSQFGRPEIEMVGVPAMWLWSAMERIQHWAHYAAFEDELREGEAIREGDEYFHPFLLIHNSPDESGFWAKQELKCIRITMGAVGEPIDESPIDPQLLN